MMKLIFVLALVALSWHLTQSVPGGAQIRVTSKGLQYGASIGMKVLKRELNKVKIPNLGDKKDIVLGHIHWAARGLHIKNVHIPKYSLRPVSGGKLRASVSGVTVGAGGHISGGVTPKGVTVCVPFPCGWKICNHCHTVRPPGIGIGTGVNINARSNSFSIEFTVGVNKGKPTIRAGNCHARAPSIGVSMTNGLLDVIYKAIAPVLMNLVRPIIEKSICGVAVAAINGGLNSFFSFFPTSLPIDRHTLINYALRQVSGTNNYFDMILRGEFQSLRNPKPSNLPMTLFPPSSSSHKMVYVWVSDFTLNTFGKVYHDAGLFNIVFDKTVPDILKPIQVLMNTNTLAPFFPNLTQSYPDRPMEFRLSAEKAPTFHFQPGSASANLHAAAFFDVIKEDGTKLPAFWIKVKVDASGKVSLSKGATKLHAEIIGVKFTAEVGGYTLGKFNLPLDGPEVKGIVDGLVGFANPALKRGLPLPRLPGIRLKNEKLSFVKNAARVEADVEVAF